jgi:hypothetical protein
MQAVAGVLAVGRLVPAVVVVFVVVVVLGQSHGQPDIPPAEYARLRTGAAMMAWQLSCQRS